MNRIGSILPVEPTEEDINIVTQEKQNLLSKSFDEIKQENMELILSNEGSVPNYQVPEQVLMLLKQPIMLELGQIEEICCFQVIQVIALILLYKLLIMVGNHFAQMLMA